jgi:predicted permease
MLAIAAIILPVFLIVGSGYAAVRLFGFTDTVIDGVMTYAIRFAVPILLFRAVYTLDLGQAFDWRLLLAFYGGALFSYVTAILLARHVWRRTPGESAAIGFCALFSNTLMLGLAVLERSYGAASLPYGFMILSVHSPTVYFIGIVVMEFARRDGAGPVETLTRATRAMLGNNLMVGVGLGFAFNLSGLTLPEPLVAAVDQIAASALPASLFAMGGALTRYSLRADIGVAAMVAGLSLFVHPLVAAGVATWLELPTDMARAAVVLAAMPTGMNGYLFAAQYRRAEGAAASSVLLGTAASVLTASFWLAALGLLYPE